MTKTSYIALITCISTAALLSACIPAQAPAPAAAPEAAPAASVPAPGVEAKAPAATTTAAASPTVGADYPVARDACLTEVAKQTGVAQDKLVATEVLWAEAGVGVTVQVPDADAPWSCLSDEKGKVQGAAYTGSEGKL